MTIDEAVRTRPALTEARLAELEDFFTRVYPVQGHEAPLDALALIAEVRRLRDSSRRQQAALAYLAYEVAPSIIRAVRAEHRLDD